MCNRLPMLSLDNCTQTRLASKDSIKNLRSEAGCSTPLHYVMRPHP